MCDTGQNNPLEGVEHQVGQWAQGAGRVRKELPSRDGIGPCTGWSELVTVQLPSSPPMQVKIRNKPYESGGMACVANQTFFMEAHCWSHGKQGSATRNFAAIVTPRRPLPCGSIFPGCPAGTALK